MNKGVKFIFLPSLVNILIVACQLALWPTTEPAGLTTPTPTVTQSLAGPSPTFTSLAVATLTPTSIAALPTPTAPTGGLTAVPTVTPSPSSLANPVGGPTQIPVMPEAIPDDMSTGWGMALSGFTGEEVSSYTAPTSLEAVRDFYQAELPGLGWEWLYTDIGESLALSRSAAVLIQEFNQGHQRLAVVAMANWGFRSDGPPAVLVVSGQNISGGELLSAFVSLVAGGFDLGPPTQMMCGRRQCISRCLCCNLITLPTGCRLAYT